MSVYREAVEAWIVYCRLPKRLPMRGLFALYGFTLSEFLP